ncbi:MAG: hypothetical protein M0036_16460 [Desulfobacteraceae bacterium]|nr:hypothetical protein [Desulfobacteraceae bacterium]
MSEKKIVAIETLGGPLDSLLQSMLRMVPEKDKSDLALQRLLAFRLRTDGEGDTRDYLMRKIRDMIQCRYNGRLYDFLKNDSHSRACDQPSTTPEPPETA